MKLTVLCDNNTIIDQYYLAEPALSIYIEDNDKHILFDTGYSDIFKLNAQKLNIDLTRLDTIVLSHGHNDHTGGLIHLNNLSQPINVYAHPSIDETKTYFGIDVSMPNKFTELNANFNIIKTRKPLKISDNIYFLGEIERTIEPLRYLDKDPLLDDSAIVYKNNDGIFIITGCSHAGICNIIEQAKKVTACDNILGVFGGFHLLNDLIHTKEVCSYFKKQNIKVAYPCHCTDLKAKIALSKVVNIEEVGVSSTIILD